MECAEPGLSGWLAATACPVNGAVAAAGERVAVAWFTGADKTPRVKLAFSNDAGETFGQPVAVDDGNPTGRVDVLLLVADGRAGLLARAARRWRRACGVRPDGRRWCHSRAFRNGAFKWVSADGASRRRTLFAWTGGGVFIALRYPKSRERSAMTC